MTIKTNNLKKITILALKGIAMGSADIVPGVSGGTIAFITGIYEELINSIKSVDVKFVKYLLSFKIKKAFERINIHFLWPLFIGIVAAFISLAHLVSFALHKYPELTWSFFFGLVVASILFIGKKIKNPFGRDGVGLIIGAFFGYFIVGLIPVSTPNALWFIYVSGLIAICAMILPGISGSFILLLLCKYEFMINVLKNPVAEGNIIIITVFALGCISGLISFSRVLGYMFKKYHNMTIALLTGLIAGSLRKIWPWKEALELRMIRGEEVVVREANILPGYDFGLLLAFILMLIGFLVVTMLGNRSMLKKSYAPNSK